MEKTNIYILIDPRDNKVRYVGKANNIKERLRSHLNPARKHQIHKKNWINSLKKEKLKPIIEIIDEVPKNNWQFWETYWISQFKNWGFDLINYTEGGDGCTFANQTSFKKGQGAKPIVGFDCNCNKLCEFNSTTDAEEFYKTRGIWHAINNDRKRKTAKNIAWFYKEQLDNFSKEDLEIEIKRRFIKERNPNSNTFVKGQKGTHSKKVLMYDLNNNLLKEFESAKLASEYLGIKTGTLQFRITKAKTNKFENYIVKYK